MSEEPEIPRLVRVIRKVVIPTLFFFWGIGVAGFSLFPYQLISEPLSDLQRWINGSAEGERLSFGEKIEALLIDPELRVSGESKISERLKLPLKPVRDPQGLLKQSPRKLSYYSTYAPGYYLLFYIPHLPDAYFGALILSGDGEVKRVIKRPISGRGRRVLGQGGVTEDGLLIFNSYFSLYVTDICGEQRLHIPMEGEQTFSQGIGEGFHHKASGEGSLIWTWFGNNLRQYDVKTQNLKREISLTEIVAANPELSLFESRLIKSNHRGGVGQWKYNDLRNGLTLQKVSLHDPFHQNDVDVLTAERAQRFPFFLAGDLLLSFRSINLIVVIDPKTLKVKWHHSGHFSRQHDPDWGVNGEIIIYDNRSHQKYSRILSIDPQSQRIKTLIDGKEWGFYQFAQGNQHLSDESRVLFTNNSEAAHATNDRLDFYFKYENDKGKALDIGTVYHINESQYQRWVNDCSAKAKHRREASSHVDPSTPRE